MAEENKKKTTVWLYPGTMRRMDSWLEEANCSSRSEFVEKALHFYLGYLATDDASEYLSKALVDTQRGILNDNANRLRGLLFKWAVELGVMTHTIAAHFKDTMEDQDALRGYVVGEVKRTNGQISFRDALDIQRQPESDDEWLE